MLFYLQICVINIQHAQYFLKFLQKYIFELQNPLKIDTEISFPGLKLVEQFFYNLKV